jgi:hypothetical protein
MKNGVTINVKVTELRIKPNPNNRRKRPVSIGFLDIPYGPSVINFLGGFSGTGVPPDFIK